MNESKTISNNEMLAIFTDAYRPKLDGVSVTLENMVKYFDSTGYKYHLFAPKTPGEYIDNNSTFRLSSVPIIFQPELRWSFPIGIKAFNALRKTHYSHIHSQSPGPMGIMAWSVAKLMTVPHFHTFHTYYPDYSHYVFNGKVLSKEMVTKLCVFWVNRVDFVIAPSSKVKNWLVSNGGRTPIEVIPNGIDVKKFSPAKEVGGRDYFIRRGLVRKDDRVVLFVGRMGQEKSIDVLINYFVSALPSLANDIKLIVVGDGPDMKKLRALVAALGAGNRVLFTGYIDPREMPDAYRAADIFAFMSTSETQGLVVAEAMASGLPVLLAKDDAFAEVLVEGENGYSVENESDFIKKLALLSSEKDLLDKLSINARETALHISIERQLSVLEEFYQQGISDWPNRKSLRTVISAKKLKEISLKFLKELRGIIERTE